MFQHELGIPQVGFSLGSGDNAHAPNESIYEEHFYLAIDMAIHFYHHLAETMS